jgi:hypothetical protein
MADRPKAVDPDKPQQCRKQLKVVQATRLGQRKQVAETWLQEEENSRYRYDVEVCKDGKTIYLLRPTWLNKGFDFQINLEGFPSKSKEAPRHDDIINDLASKKKELPEDYRKLRELIDDVYECVEPDEAIKKHPNLTFRSGLPVDTVLKILKWLFIEQDLTYWNNTGRRKLMKDGINELD